MPPGPAPDNELACAGCGYNLAGLQPSGLCPECGMAVARSLALIEGHDAARWLRHVAWGAGLAAAGCACLAVLGPAVALESRLGPEWEWVTPWAWGAAGVTAAVLWPVGWRLVGSKAPRAKAAPMGRLDWVVRTLAPLSVAPAAALACGWVWGARGGAYDALAVIAISGLALLGATAVLWVAGFLWLHQVCTRLRRPALARACTMATLLLVLGALAGYVARPEGFAVAGLLVFGYGAVVLAMVARAAMVGRRMTA